MSSPQRGPHDEALPATLTFVMLIGATFLILWFAMYALLQARW